MNKERFLRFRGDLAVLRDFLKNGEDIDSLFNGLVALYPELTNEYVWPDSVERGESREQVVTKKRRKSKEEIRKQLLDSIEVKRFIDYTGVKFEFDNEETCLETLRNLDAAESDARKRTVYFSCLKGQVLKRLKDISGKKMSQILKLTTYSKAHAYFLISLHDLAHEYNSLMYSDLPLRFFKTNFKDIQIICNANKTLFK